jgi:hypothetical protein
MLLCVSLGVEEDPFLFNDWLDLREMTSPRGLAGSCPHQGKGYDEELFSIEKCMEWNFEDLKEQEKTGAEFYLMSI